MEISNALVLIGLAFAMAGLFSLLCVTGAILGKLCLAAFVANDSEGHAAKRGFFFLFVFFASVLCHTCPGSDLDQIDPIPPFRGDYNLWSARMRCHDGTMRHHHACLINDDVWRAGASLARS